MGSMFSSHEEAQPKPPVKSHSPPPRPRVVEDDPSLSLESFTIVKVLGKGAFGKVMMVTKKGDLRTLYALKTLQKKKMLQTSQIAHVHTERMVLEKVHSPFMVHLAFAFQTDEKLYMVLEYCDGGDLFHWITVTAQKERRYGFGEDRCKLYAAELILAIHAMHQQDIIHRDLKPENILLDSAGHIKVTDFGLAKHHVAGFGEAGGASTFCGTGEYMAPEIIFSQIRSSGSSKSAGNGNRYGKEVDWWSVGVVIYEMLSFDLPFKPDAASKTKDDKGKQLALFESILHEPIQFHKKLHSESAREVMRGFLCRDAPRRLGCAVGDAGFQAITNMPFFRSLDFNLVLAKQIPVEFIPPQGKGAANFDREFTGIAPMDSYIAPLTSSEKRKTQFVDFAFAGEGGGGGGGAVAEAGGGGGKKVGGGLGKKR